MQQIMNLTQHKPTSDQVKVGVFEPLAKERVLAYLNFNDGIPTKMLLVADVKFFLY